MDELKKYTSLYRIIATVSELSPDHQKFLGKSFLDRSVSELELSNHLSELILRIKDKAVASACSNYLWTCDQLREEMLYFFREERYRFSKLEDAIKHVYENTEYMEKYLDGLLLTQVLWKNQFDVVVDLVEKFLTMQSKPFRHLEVGPGHGLLLYLAARSEKCLSAEGWDISASSLAHTRSCLDKLSANEKVTLRLKNAELTNETQSDKFDTVVISEVLEHVEEPVTLLKGLRNMMNADGLIFVNVPINSPALDHIYLLESKEQSVRLVSDSGFEIVESRFHPMVGYTVETALDRMATVSCVIIGRNHQL